MRVRLHLDEAKHSVIPTNQVDLAVIASGPKILRDNSITQAAQVKVRLHLTQAGGREVCGFAPAEISGGHTQGASHESNNPEHELSVNGSASREYIDRDCARGDIRHNREHFGCRDLEVSGACCQPPLQTAQSRKGCRHALRNRDGESITSARTLDHDFAPWELRVRNQFWTAPNQLTLLRLIFIPFVITNVLEDNWRWALSLLVLAGLSDALDGWLARVLDQRTLLGQYLDPIADKLLLSSLFLVLSIAHKIPWKYTVLVLSRDVCILATCMALYATVGFRDFRPSIFGKINTVCQIAAVFFVVLAQVVAVPAVLALRTAFLYATFGFTLLSGIHYILVTGYRLRTSNHKLPAT